MLIGHAYGGPVVRLVARAVAAGVDENESVVWFESVYIPKAVP